MKGDVKLRRRVLVRTVVGTVVAAAACVFAAPASADTTDVTDFINTLDSLGITDIDPGEAVALGQSLCPLLAQRGQNTADIAMRVSEAIGRPIGAAGMFTGAAVSLLCPRAVDKIAQGRPLLPLFG